MKHPDGLRELQVLVQEWVEIGWCHDEGEPFSFEGRLGRFYDWTSTDTLFFDDFDPERRVNFTAEEYASIWNMIIPRLKKLTNEMVGKPSIIVSGDLAVMDVRFITSFETTAGVINQADTLSSLVWRRSEHGWRIIREHGTAISPSRA